MTCIVFVVEDDVQETYQALSDLVPESKASTPTCCLRVRSSLLAYELPTGRAAGRTRHDRSIGRSRLIEQHQHSRPDIRVGSLH